MSIKLSDAKIRICIYLVVAVVFVFVFSHTLIINNINISAAEDCYKNKNYVCAFKAYKKAFASGIDNNEYVEHYFETLNRMKKIALVQEEMNSLLQNYPDNPVNAQIEAVFYNIRREFRDKNSDNYIDDVVQGSSIVHWNNKAGKIKIFIDSAMKSQMPPYYFEEIKKVINDYKKVMKGALDFEIVSSQEDADIDIVFMNKISGGQCDNSQNCNDILGLTENNISGVILTKSVLKLRTRDIDNSKFTPNQIYNIVKHEFGHALGIAGHSYVASDIMYPVSNDASWAKNERLLLIERRDFSPRDIRTLEILYKIVPDVTNKKYDTAKFPDMYMPIAVIGTRKEIGEKKLAESKRYINMVASNYISQVNLAEGYFTNKDFPKAKEAFMKALALASTKEEKFAVYNNLAVIAYNENDYNQAIEYADMANSYSETLESNEIKAYCYIELKKYADAQKLFEKLIQKSPENPSFSAALVDVYFKQYKSISAIKELKRMKKINRNLFDDPLFKRYKVFAILV